MNKTLTLILALAAGILGGLLTRYTGPPTAFAQKLAPIAKEIRAESFSLVDSSDRVLGTFTAESAPGISPLSSRTRIVLRDSSGRVIWSAAGGNGVRPASER
jgi:hypothetical protein